MRTLLRFGVVLAVVAGALGLVASTTSPARGFCAAPALTVPRHARPGATITVTGRYFITGCSDAVGVGGGGCGPTRVEREESHPTRDIHVTITQRGHRYALGDRDAGANGRLRVAVTLPAALRPGPAVVTATGDHGTTGRARVRIAS